MRKRIFMLMALALMVVAAMALSGVAQAAGSPKARCQQEAELLTGSTLTSYNVVVGNNKRADNFTLKGTDGVAEVFCGFGGNDEIGTLEAGDIFIGGAGDDSVYDANYGTFIGDAGIDAVWDNTLTGTFNGEVGNDTVTFNYGTFNGGDGNDSVVYNYTDIGALLYNVEVVDNFVTS